MSESQKEVGIISNLILNNKIRSLVEKLERNWLDTEKTDHLINELYEILSGVQSYLEIENYNLHYLRQILELIQKTRSSEPEDRLLEFITGLRKNLEKRFSKKVDLLARVEEQHIAASLFEQNNQLRLHEPILLSRYTIDYEEFWSTIFISYGLMITNNKRAKTLKFDFIPFNIEYFEPFIYHEAILMLYRGLINFQDAIQKKLFPIDGKTKIEGVTNQIMAKFFLKVGCEIRKVSIEGSDYQVEFDLNNLGHAMEAFKQMKFKPHGRSQKPYLSLDDLWDIYLR